MNNNDESMVVNAFRVSGKIDYTKLTNDFGSKIVDPSMISRLEAIILKKGNVKTLHRFIRRSIFFSHRDLDKILTLLENDKPFYLYTGRGPSSEAMHIGHLVPFLMTQWLQEAFDVPLVIQLTDDEKFIWKGSNQDGDDNLDYYRKLSIENSKDIIACGFKKDKTFIFSDVDYMGVMYPNVVRIWKCVTYNQVRSIFGFEGSSNIGQSAFPAIQAAPSFPSSFPIVLNAARDSEMACLIPCAIDQDPYFRMTRDIASKLTPKSHPLGGKPALFHSKFFPPLQGTTGKMSSSDDDSAVFLSDSPETIKRKIKTRAFSGGQETGKLQRELGADLETDVSYQWLKFFLEDDDELERIGESYESGQGDYWATGQVKDRLIKLLTELVSEHQEKRLSVTDEEVFEWMKVRELTM
jgi:tryptophanyl-tRNA synthetase